MLSYYQKSKPIIQRTAVYETRTYGGVRGNLANLTVGEAVYSIFSVPIVSGFIWFFPHLNPSK